MKKYLVIGALLVSAITASAQNIDSWTPQSLKAHFGAASAKYVGGRIRKITFSAGPNGNFHGPQRLELILEVLRGDKENPDLHGRRTPNVDFVDDSLWIDRETGCTITQYTSPGKSWEFTVTKEGLPMVLKADVVEWRSGGPHGGPELYLDIN
jgi:hypothetical protein